MSDLIKGFSSAQYVYENMEPPDDDDDQDEDEVNPCEDCERRGHRCLGTDCPV
jgi:hypothetical protein